jgi:ergothioneine biosynthesis protein EgtB
MPRWCEIAEGVYEIGHAGEGFAFDNEGPRHRTYVQAAKVATRLVTNREYLAFMADAGYRRPELWLSSGWDVVRGERWEAPLYWERESRDAPWQAFTLRGTQVIDDAVLDAPVCHVSFFEADAYARWKGMRLPTEAEWEVVAASVPLDATRDAYAEGGHYHPIGDDVTKDVSAALPSQLFGTVWQWTASPYVGYPGYRPVAGAIGEYNGKWMCDQWVLRGASCATPRSHARHTYRNFFPAATRWQFAGIRLAADA